MIHAPDTSQLDSGTVDRVLSTVGQLSDRYGIAAQRDFLESTRLFAQDQTLNVAVLGRFKAGKSSFLNHLLGRPLLPVGVIPVTSVVTRIQWGPIDRAIISFLDGRREDRPLDAIAAYISEIENPGNREKVACVDIQLVSMDRYRGLRFVDTPGLESVHTHNTDTSLEWLPNVGVALVAVGVDPPLSRHDTDLIRDLSRYTPNISLLLTKFDLLGEPERLQVLDFVRDQLARYSCSTIPVFPYSVRPGFENLRADLDAGLLDQARAAEQRTTILTHKLKSLLNESTAYLNVALKAAELADSEREDLMRKILGQRELLDDTRLALKLIVRHASAAARATFENVLRPEQSPLQQSLQAQLDREFPAWTSSLRMATDSFDDWMRIHLATEMLELSRKHRDEFVAPARRTGRQLTQSLQDFRNRLSQRLLETLGVPLRTTEMELHAREPGSPDVRVGRIFDHNWELLSWLIPMSLLQGVVHRHFRRKVSYLVSINLSRLATQWETIVTASMFTLEKDAIRRLDKLIVTIESLIASAGQQAPRIRDDLQTITALHQGLDAGGAGAARQPASPSSSAR